VLDRLSETLYGIVASSTAKVATSLPAEHMSLGAPSVNRCSPTPPFADSSGGDGVAMTVFKEWLELRPVSARRFADTSVGPTVPPYRLAPFVVTTWLP
jgi:hypothetical protein